MLRFFASYLTSNIKPNTTNDEVLQETVFNFNAKNFVFTTETEHSDEVEQPEDISLLRERKLQELTEKVLLRKIYRQVVMNRHAQDHLPLAQIQEKLEEDDLPLKVLQDKLRQKENSSIYTTIRENINFLLYNKSSKSKKSKPSLSTPIITDTVNTSDNNNVSTPKDDRNYDVWDDAIIGHLMNLVETIGVEIIQDENSGETIKETKDSAPKVDRGLINRVVNEVINEVMREEEFKNKSSNLDDIKGSTKVTTKKEDKEIIVAESSSIAAMKNIGKNTVKNIEKNTVRNIEKNSVKNIEKYTMKNIENNTVKNIGKNTVKKYTVKNIENNTVKNIGKNTVKNIEKYTVKNIENNTSTNIENNFATNNATTDIENVIAENDLVHVKNVKNDIMDDIQENIQEDTNLESRKIAEEIINFGETINVAESLLRSDNLMNDNASFRSTRSVKRKFRPSIFSLSQSTSIPNIKNPDQTHHTLKRSVSDLNRRGSIHSKKSYENDLSRRSSISSKFSFNNATTDVIIEEQNEDDSNHNKYFKRNPSTRKSLKFIKNILKNNENLSLANNEESFLSSREIRERYYQQFDGDQRVYPKTIGTAGDRSDPGYSNFYLSMPNGKWMVRTRTASRKITDTQYVEKEFI